MTSHESGAVISVMLAVGDASAAARWYAQALGAVKLWNLGGVVGLSIEGAPFFVGEPETNGWDTPSSLGNRTARVEVFVSDPDEFIGRAVAAGADGSVDQIRNHSTPWGLHRQGGFLDPFGHLWLVGDRSPLQAVTTSATGPAPSSRSSPVSGVTILDVSGLTINYGPTRAVNGLGLQVTRGEIFGLLGPNGAGKTSTLSAIEGLLEPQSGTILLDGIDALRHPIEAKVRMGVQLQATSFQTSLTLKQIVRLYAGLYGVAFSDADITRVLTEVALEADLDKEFKQLSGGQKQRLSLQIAVIHEPALLLLDEPTSGLDPQARRQLWTRIEHLRQKGGSILLTTHSMEEAQAVCDRVAIMDHGEIITCASPKELIALHRDDPRVRAIAHGEVTLDDVFVGLTGSEIRD